MFFNAHKEGLIGYKKLTDADLGRGTSHQTHIGLYGDVLTYLQDQEVEQSAMFIYKDTCDIIDCYFDRIENPDGTFRSPKIRKGPNGSISVVTIIRDLVAEEKEYFDWFLIWFGLESGEIVFYLFNVQSANFEQLANLLNLSNKSNGRIISTDHLFENLIRYLENIVNINSTELISELEVVSQIGSNRNRRFKQFDIERANKIFKDIGRQGEVCVAQYLDKLKFENKITNFSWFNSESESGLPFDFTIQDLRQNIIHMDVKSTSFKFEQPMIFSNQEVEFITETPNYHIYRVYDLSEDIKHLKICADSKLYMPSLKASIDKFSSEIEVNKAKLQTIKLAIPPLMDKLTFSNEISLCI